MGFLSRSLSTRLIAPYKLYYLNMCIVVNHKIRRYCVQLVPMGWTRLPVANIVPTLNGLLSKKIWLVRLTIRRSFHLPAASSG